ncbi:MAG: hypothetical protein HC939_05260 [Pleurocapsa sp. SU_5_0]|nr:hypothetical protein [Pleurocapsa sp. SU_5_0]NJO97266.1 hypothetical protein [Pleurocapsa sp. CRU_1_2]
MPTLQRSDRSLYLNLERDEETLFQSQLSKMELQEQEQIMQITTSWEQKGIIKGRIEEKLAIEDNEYQN